MTDLVTDATIEAALRGVRDTPSDEALATAISNGVYACAPLIAAEALRKAAEQVGKFEKESSRDGYVVAVSTAISYLSGKADELEGK